MAPWLGSQDPLAAAACLQASLQALCVSNGGKPCRSIPSGSVGTRLRGLFEPDLCLGLRLRPPFPLPLPPEEIMGDWRESLPCSGEDSGG